jgi:hypothetical protein
VVKPDYSPLLRPSFYFSGEQKSHDGAKSKPQVSSKVAATANKKAAKVA